MGPRQDKGDLVTALQDLRSFFVQVDARTMNLSSSNVYSLLWSLELYVMISNMIVISNPPLTPNPNPKMRQEQKISFENSKVIDLYSTSRTVCIYDFKR